MNSRPKSELLVKILFFFFGILFYALLGRHFFSRLGGTKREKTEVMKLYYGGLAFWIILIVLLITLDV